MSLADIIPDFSQSFVLYRRGTGFSRKGKYTKGPLTAIPMTEALWPSKGSELEELPESLRTHETITIVSRTEIKGLVEGIQQDPDIVLYNGKFYEVHKVQNWIYGGFYRSVAVRLSQSSLAALVYFGVGEAGLEEEDDVLDLGILLLTSKDTFFQVTTADEERIFFVVPASFGIPTFVVDGEEIEFEDTEVEIGEVEYVIYESPEVEVGSHSVDTR